VALYQPLLSYVTSVNSTSIEKDKPVVDSADRYQNVTEWAISLKTVYMTK
jgi:hypothetical protein